MPSVQKKKNVNENFEALVHFWTYSKKGSPFSEPIKKPELFVFISAALNLLKALLFVEKGTEDKWMSLVWNISGHFWLNLTFQKQLNW